MARVRVCRFCRGIISSGLLAPEISDADLFQQVLDGVLVKPGFQLKSMHYCVGAGFPRPTEREIAIRGGETPPLHDFRMGGRWMISTIPCI